MVLQKLTALATLVRRSVPCLPRLRSDPAMLDADGLRVELQLAAAVLIQVRVRKVQQRRQECTICLEPMERPTPWPAGCGHSFCHHCVTRCAHADRSLRCPLCRKAPPPPAKPPPLKWYVVATPTGGMVACLCPTERDGLQAANDTFDHGFSRMVELTTDDYWRLLHRRGPPPRLRLRDRAVARLRLPGRPRRPATVPAWRFRVPRPGPFESALIFLGEGVEELLELFE